MASDLANAVAKVVDVLSPLASEERVRVVNASLTLLGEGTTSNVMAGSRQSGSPAGGEGVGGQLGVSSQASTWLSKNNMSKEDLEHWYHFEQDAVTLLAIPGGVSKRSQQAINTYLLLGFAAFLRSGEASFSDQEARAQCQHFGCYDHTNHAKIYKAFGNRITGSKSAGWKLTAPGINAAGALLKGGNAG